MLKNLLRRRVPIGVGWDPEVDTEMVAIAKAIIAQRTGALDPNAYKDRYQEALRELIEGKMKGLPVKPKEIAAPPPVIDLMAALKRSLAQETTASERTGVGGKRTRRHRIGAKQPCCCRSLAVGNGNNPVTLQALP